MTGRVVVVTGASAGVGRATARAFAAAGDAVALLARNRDALQAAAAEVEAEGVRALVCVVDIADADAVEEAAATIEAELGPIDDQAKTSSIQLEMAMHRRALGIAAALVTAAAFVLGRARRA